MDPIFTPAVTVAAAEAAATAAAAGIPGITAAAVTPAVGGFLGTGLSAGTLLTGAGLGLSALNSAAQGNQANANARYQAELYERQAERERQIAALDESEYRRRGSAMLASQRARLGDAGVDFTGTALDLSDATAAELELQALKIRSGGLARAGDLESQAALSRYVGTAARNKGFLNAATTAAEGAFNIFGPRRARVADTVEEFG
jgi:hypothetical protein